ITAFSSELTDQFDALNKSAGTLTNVIHTIYSQDTLAPFESNSVSSSGGTSILIVGVAVFVVAFLVFAAIAYFTGRKGAKAKKAPSSQEPLGKSGDNEKAE
ncbi:MAG: hypothetical protein K2N74_06200, partial [Clostridiales bacterium]|nr:hypothetical protein [Clostridiales bacterium]